jgi:hypothetical protein
VRPAQHMAAEHPVAAGIDDKLHQGRFLAAGQYVPLYLTEEQARGRYGEVDNYLARSNR